MLKNLHCLISYHFQPLALSADRNRGHNNKEPQQTAQKDRQIPQPIYPHPHHVTLLSFSPFFSHSLLSLSKAWTFAGMWLFPVTSTSKTKSSRLHLSLPLPPPILLLLTLSMTFSLLIPLWVLFSLLLSLSCGFSFILLDKPPKTKFFTLLLS